MLPFLPEMVLPLHFIQISCVFEIMPPDFMDNVKGKDDLLCIPHVAMDGTMHPSDLTCVVRIHRQRLHVASPSSEGICAWSLDCKSSTYGRHQPRPSALHSIHVFFHVRCRGHPRLDPPFLFHLARHFYFSSHFFFSFGGCICFLVSMAPRVPVFSTRDPFAWCFRPGWRVLGRGRVLRLRLRRRFAPSSTHVSRALATHVCAARGRSDGADASHERGVGGRRCQGRQNRNRWSVGARGGPHRGWTHAEAKEETRGRMRDRARNQGACTKRNVQGEPERLEGNEGAAVGRVRRETRTVAEVWSMGARRRRVLARRKRMKRSAEAVSRVQADVKFATNVMQKRNRTRPPVSPLGAVEIVDPATLKRNGPAAKRRGNATPENSRKCTVCLGEMEKMSSTTCGHVFCWDCIRRAVATQQKCPTCRKKLTAKQIHRIYL